MKKNSMKNPFMSPTGRGLHPHVVRETGQENRQDMYETEDDVFSAFQKGRDPLRGVPILGGLGQAAEKNGAVVSFIKEYPIFSAITAIGLGALVYKALTGKSDDVDDLFTMDPQYIQARVRNPTEQQHLLPANTQVVQPSQIYVQQQEPIVIRSREQPPVTITMPSEKGVDISAPGMVGGSYQQIKKKRRRHKPDRVQVRDQSGKFTSKTVKVK